MKYLFPLLVTAYILLVWNYLGEAEAYVSAIMIGAGAAWIRMERIERARKERMKRVLYPHQYQGTRKP